MESGKKKNINSSQMAYLRIKELISEYKLVPGQNVNYGDLADKLKMSKTPIINALNRLAQEEFCIYVNNRGFFLKEIDIEEVTELFSIRGILQVFAVEESIRNYNDDMMCRIEDAMIRHRNYPLRIITRERQVLDAAFHIKIAEMAGSRNLIKMLRNVFERIYLRHRTEGIPQERFFESAEEHENIFNAIKKRNVAEAKALMEQHEKGGRAATIKGIAMATKKIGILF